jgi:pectate lyase
MNRCTVSKLLVPDSILEERAMNWEHKSLTSTWISAQLCIVVLALLFATSLYAAFEGFGSSTPGGDNGSQVTVTSLADSGPGTLREALAGNNRLIVFAVAGTIKLSSDLSVRDRSFITIDGSSAPSPGITIQGRGIDIRNSHDIIVTHMRVRNAGNDGISVRFGSYNVVIDHCSVTDSVDGNIDITEGAHDVTVSWTILGHTRPNWYDLTTRGMLLNNETQPAATNLSMHHNFWINNYQRGPEVSTAALVDIRNNVFWDWGARATRFNQAGHGNVIGNIYVKPESSNRDDALVLQSDSGPVHVAGNLGPEGININAQSTAATPLAVAPVTTDPAVDVEEIVRQLVGAFPRDAVDTSLVGDGGSPPPPPPPPPTNQAPTVNAGSNQTITLPALASLDGTVTDDGLPNPTVATIWTKVSGPGTVSFANASAIDTTASFTLSGTYVLRLTANDGALSVADDVTVTVNPAPPPPPPPSGQAVTSFTLINADTDQPIATFNPLNNGVTLNLATLPTRNLNIRANTSPAIVGSVRFGWNTNSNYRTQNDAPYALGGDNNGNYSAWRPSRLGTQALTATPYTRSDARGTAGTALTITFSVIDQPK